MNRSYALDTEFLFLDDVDTPMLIGCLCIFEGSVPSREEIKTLALRVVTENARYRQRLDPGALALGRMHWVDDPHFVVDSHVHEAIVPPPHDERALGELMGRLMTGRLRRDRPLWELWRVGELGHDRWAIIAKVHHALADGQAGIKLLTSLLDREPADRADQASAAAAPPPTRPSGEAVSRAGFSIRALETLSRGTVRLLQSLRPRGSTSIQGRVGPRRGFATARLPLADLQRVKRAAGGTINDIVLALLAGAYRRLMEERGDDVAGEPLRTLVPISMRASDPQDGRGNVLAAFICDLPTHLADPAARVRAMVGQMAELKCRTGMRETTNEWVHAFDHVPGPLLALVTRLAARALRRFPQRSVATLTTHVRGPDKPRSALGRTLVAFYPYAPIFQGMRVATAVASYAGTLHVGVTVDDVTIPDAGFMARAVETELASLLVSFEL